MLDIYAIRKANLEALADQLRQAMRGAKEKDIAAALDMSASYFTQLKSGSSIIGDATARKIEEIRGLPHGWMDNVHTGSSHRTGESAPPYVSQGLRIDPATISAALRLVRLAFLNRDEVIDQEVNGEPLAHAYEFLMARRENAATAENVVEFGMALRRRQAEGGNDAQTGDDRGAGGNRRKRVTGSKAS
jgi:hypothetical protein